MPLVLLKFLYGRNGTEGWSGVPVEVVLIEFGNAGDDLFIGDVPDVFEAEFGDVGEFVVGAVFLVVEDAEGGGEVEEYVVEVDADGEGVFMHNLYFGVTYFSHCK